MATRLDLQTLANARLAEAGVLLDNGLFSGAYYLAGYAVELAPKVLISGKFVANEIPDRAFVNKVHTHVLVELIEHAGLKPELTARRLQDDQFGAGWEIAKAWNESARYRIIEEADAHALVDSISHPQHGVFPWIRTYW